MYIFSRARRAKPSALADAMAGAIDIGGTASTVAGHDVHVWLNRFGAPAGTFTWSARFDSQAQMHDAFQKLFADPAYMDQAKALDDVFEGETQDSLIKVVSGNAPEAPSQFYEVVRATMANGKFVEAMEWGAEIQAYVSDKTGRPGVFGAAAYGGFADVGWLSGFDTMEQVDEYVAFESDEGYLDRLSKSGELFVEGSGHRGLIERLN